MNLEGLSTRIFGLVKKLSCFLIEEQIQAQVNVYELSRDFIPISSLLIAKYRWVISLVKKSIWCEVVDT